MPWTWKQTAQGDPDRKWRRLLSHPLWDEVEARLRARWSPRKIALWLKTAHPKAPRLSFRTLYRYLQDKPESWFVNLLTVAEGSKVAHARVSRLLVMEEHAEAMLAMKRRIARFLEFEESLGNMPVQEVRANIELFARMCEQYLKMEQAMGYAPSGGLHSRVQGMPLNEDDEGDDRELLKFVQNMVKLPPAEFGELLRLALGPPPPGTEVVETPRVIDVKPRRADDG